MLGVKPIDVYTIVAVSVASLNFLKSIPACISPGKGKNGSTVAVSAEYSSFFSILSKNSNMFAAIIFILFILRKQVFFFDINKI